MNWRTIIVLIAIAAWIAVIWTGALETSPYQYPQVRIIP